MPRRALGHLKNLGNWALKNTKKTLLLKGRKLRNKKNKENEPPAMSDQARNATQSEMSPETDASLAMMPEEAPHMTACKQHFDDGYTALNGVDILQMRRFAWHTQWFMDAYHKGLTGKQAWAGKKYHGHRVLPESLLKGMEDGGVA